MSSTNSRRPLPPVEYLRECFAYDQDSGVLTWRIRPDHHFKTDKARKIITTRDSGKSAGTACASGHLVVGIDYRHYRVNRIIWKMVTGNEPPDEIDHEDTDRQNNQWSNLRAATPGQNRCNRGLQRNNTSGFKGVTWDKRRKSWFAQIKLNRKNHSLGHFDTAEKAHAAYCEAALRMHGGFARTSESLTQNPEGWK